MEHLRSADIQDQVPESTDISEWTPEELQEAYFYHEERLPKSELHADALTQIESEIQRRKDLMKG